LSRQVEEDSSEQRPSRRTCSYFHLRKGCDRGAGCRFVHEVRQTLGRTTEPIRREGSRLAVTAWAEARGLAEIGTGQAEIWDSPGPGPSWATSFNEPPPEGGGMAAAAWPSGPDTVAGTEHSKVAVVSYCCAAVSDDPPRNLSQQVAARPVAEDVRTLGGGPQEPRPLTEGSPPLGDLTVPTGLRRASRLCRFFNSRSGCTAGISCLYTHSSFVERDRGAARTSQLQKVGRGGGREPLPQPLRRILHSTEQHSEAQRPPQGDGSNFKTAIDLVCG